MARHSRSSTQSQSADRLPPVLVRWLLRILVPLNGHQAFVRTHGFQDDAVAEALGLEDWIDPEHMDFDPKAVRLRLRQLHQAWESTPDRLGVPRNLARNVEQLAKLVGLSETDCRLLEFTVLIHNERVLDDTADLLGPLSSGKVFHVLAVILDLPEAETRQALRPDSTLCRSGLVSVDRNGPSQLRAKLDLLSAKFADYMLSHESDPVRLIRDTVILSSPSHLDFKDYPHIESTLGVLRPYLKKAVETGRRGVNIFLHGAPGTGKSQLAKLLAQFLECELFEVASEDCDGDAVEGQARLRAFRAAQCFFGQRRAMLLFDEVEDVFNDGNNFLGRKSTAQTRKGWINRMLEENPVPTFWLSNSVSGLDPAFIRRFDMVIELSVPPRHQRERIVREASEDMLDATTISRIADSEDLAPAVIARAASVVRLIRDDLGEEQVPRAIQSLISSTLEAQGHAPLKPLDPNRLPETYDPAFIHADADLADVTRGLMLAQSGRLCLFGPSGTGKTAYGRWLANRLGLPLRVRRASDLLSMWLGGTERNIARAFREAEQEGALLLIDEVDSFLQDRRGAQRSWEISGVNEMLTQMESFPGIFIATTNLMEGLDQAALRRFDLKVRFDYLKPEQAWALLQKQCAALGIEASGGDLEARLARLSILTPGDFAAVARQHRFRPLKTALAWVAALENECALKPDRPSAPIGFV